MALVIDALPIGTATNNSYVTLAEANTYFEGVLNTADWDNSDDDTKNRSLAQATSRVDQEDFYGTIVDVTQALEFPRTGLGNVNGRPADNIIPKNIKIATYDLALYMLSTNMKQKGDDNTGLKEYAVKVGSIEETKKYITDDFTSAKNYNDLPDFVATNLEPFSNTVSTGGSSEVYR